MKHPAQLNRRQLLAASTALVAPLLAGADAGGPPVAAVPARPAFGGGPLLNEARAAELMAVAGLDGLVALQPVNHYYLTSIRPLLGRMGFDYPGFGLLPADVRRGVTAVVSATELWQIANGERVYPRNVVAFGPVSNWTDYLPGGGAAPGQPPESAVGGWPVSEDADLSARETAWIAASDSHRGRLAAGPEWGLIQALREAGLDRGTIGIDDPRIAAIASMGGLAVRCVPAQNLFRRLRLVKSPAEIELMRIAARMNAAACRAAVRSFREGATAGEVETLYMQEMARRGGTGVFIVAGTTGGLPHGELRRGEPLLVDAVGHFENYHGDFGRTVVVGEASREVRRRVGLLEAGWRAALETMRPGVSYGQIREVCAQAMRKSGMGPLRIGAQPHSVGLQHTDEPWREKLPFIVKDDLVLEENMTLTVDFPHFDLGWGACHLEDLVRITADGVEVLESLAEPLLEV